MKKQSFFKYCLFLIVIIFIIFITIMIKNSYSLENDYQEPNPSLITPVYDTDETIIADYVISQSDTETDMAGTIQETLNACYNHGGGTVWLNAGTYVINSPIEVKKGCTLRGDWQDPDLYDGSLNYGTIIIVDVDKFSITDNMEQSGLFKIEDSAGVVGLTIYYKNQDIYNPYEQPWTFLYSEQLDMSNRNMLKTIKNITMINSYRGIGTAYVAPNVNLVPDKGGRPHEMLMIENVKGTVINSGVVVHNSMDVGTITGLTLKPDYWEKANLKAFGEENEKLSSNQINTLKNHMKQYGIGLVITDAEQQQFINVNISGFLYGIYIPNIETRIMGSGSFYNLNIDDCKYGIKIDSGYHDGIWMAGSNNAVGPLTMVDFGTGYLISNSSISGDHYAIENLSSEVCFDKNNTRRVRIGETTCNSSEVTLRGILKLNNVKINGRVSHGGENNTIPGTYYNNDDNGYRELIASNDIVTVGNINNKFANINVYPQTKTTGKLLRIVDSSINVGEINNILNVLSNEGGGVLYLKSGLYDFGESTIFVPSNVELRGVFGVSTRIAGKEAISEIDDLNHTINEGNVYGTVIITHPGTQTIRLSGDNSGISGITFIYINEYDSITGLNTNYEKNDPRVIASDGTSGVYVKNIALIGQAYGILFNNCSNFMISNVVSSVFDNAFWLNNCSNGTIMNNLQNLSLLSRNDLYNANAEKIVNYWTNGQSGINNGIVRTRLEYIGIIDSNNIKLVNNFIFGGWKYLHMVNSTNIYGVNNGNDGFGYVGSSGVEGWQYDFEGNNSAIMVNSLHAGGYSVNNLSGNVALYNRDHFFKSYESSLVSAIEKDQINSDISSVKIVDQIKVIHQSIEADGKNHDAIIKTMSGNNPSSVKYYKDASCNVEISSAIGKDIGEWFVQATTPSNGIYAQGMSGCVKAITVLPKSSLPTPVISLSKTSDILEYGTNGVVTITTNGDGKLLCDSSDIDVATCMIDGNNLIVVPKALQEDNKIVTVTVKQESGENYGANENGVMYTVIVNRKNIVCPNSPSEKIYSGVVQESGIICPSGSTMGGDIRGRNANNYIQTCVANSGYKFNNNCNVGWTISKKEITITAENKSMNYGSSAPIYNYIVTGTVGNETAVSGNAIYTIKNNNGNLVTVNSSLDVGEYTIIPSGLTIDSNYFATYQNGILLVNKVDAIITCLNKEYNGNNQIIATCNGGIIHNANQTNVGEYMISCTGDSNHTDASSKMCMIEDAQIITTDEAIVNDNEVLFNIDYGYNLTVSEIKRRLNKNNLLVYDKDNNLVSNDASLVGTGGKIRSLDKDYYIIIKGDINKDAKISAIDYIAIRKHMMQLSIITDPIVKKAADMDGNDYIGVLDYIAIRKLMMQ